MPKKGEIARIKRDLFTEKEFQFMTMRLKEIHKIDGKLLRKDDGPDVVFLLRTEKK